MKCSQNTFIINISDAISTHELCITDTTLYSDSISARGESIIHPRWLRCWGFDDCDVFWWKHAEWVCTRYSFILWSSHLTYSHIFFFCWPLNSLMFVVDQHILYHSTLDITKCYNEHALDCQSVVFLGNNMTGWRKCAYSHYCSAMLTNLIKV